MRVKAQKCTFFKHFSLSVLFLATSLNSAFAGELKRAPANFVPDDDIIVVPMVVERSFYKDFNEKHKERFKQSRQKLENWILQEQYAKDYGLENAGFIDLPTSEDKEQFLHRNYLRFIQKDVERSNNKTLQGIVNRWTAEDEINSIRSTEQQGEFIIKAKRARGRKVVQVTETVKVGKSSFRLDVQPRLEQGMVIVKLKSDYIYARAWLGINGKQEVLVEKDFKSTGTSLWANHYIDEKRILAAASQKIGKNWSLRLTHEKFENNFDVLTDSVVPENNILSVNFGMGF